MLDRDEITIREKQSQLNKLEHEKKDENSKAIEEAKKELGAMKDTYRGNLRKAKHTIGTELFNRFMKGFVRTKDSQEENEKIAHSEFLFKKLKF
jgi:inorganic triphosphatase YgiF